VWRAWMPTRTRGGAAAWGGRVHSWLGLSLSSPPVAQAICSCAPHNQAARRHRVAQTGHPWEVAAALLAPARGGGGEGCERVGECPTPAFTRIGDVAIELLSVCARSLCALALQTAADAARLPPLPSKAAESAPSSTTISGRFRLWLRHRPGRSPAASLVFSAWGSARGTGPAGRGSVIVQARILTAGSRSPSPCCFEPRCLLAIWRPRRGSSGGSSGRRGVTPRVLSQRPSGPERAECDADLCTKRALWLHSTMQGMKNQWPASARDREVRIRPRRGGGYIPQSKNPWP
jgi:hypothetical protein